MVRQVIMTERVMTSTGGSRNVTALAFGEHPDFLSTDDGVVTAGAVGQSFTIRVIMDELLIGNYLEEIACADGSYQPVLEGTTPDHIAACAVKGEILAETCTGPYAVCLGPDGPIGVLDEDEDGTSDDTRMIAGAVRLLCNDGAIDVPLSQTGSFWQPSGNQQVPALGGFNAVGPAIILSTVRGLPTSSDCTISFASSVVDKEHIRVCASEGGLVSNPCEPGDTSRVAWRTEPLRFVGSNPPDMATGVPLGTPNARITASFNTPLDPSVGADAFTLLEGDTERTDLTVAIDPMNASNVFITVPGGYLPDTVYTLTVETGLSDAFGVAFPADQTGSSSWTTAAAAQ